VSGQCHAPAALTPGKTQYPLYRRQGEVTETFWWSLDFLTNTYVHGLDTWNKNRLYLPVVSLSCVQKGVSYVGVRIFTSLPSNIQSYRNDRKRFKNKLYRYLIIHSFYTITEFLECKRNKDNIQSTKLLLWLTALVVNAFISIMCKFYNWSFEICQISLE